MIDLVIPYRTDPLRNGTELSWCIKSFRKFFPALGHIYVIGDPSPHGFNVPMADIAGRKQFSIVRKIERACRMAVISDPFICVSDDVYLTRELTEIPYWHSGKITMKGGRYDQYKKNSIQNGCVFNYDVHAPILYHKQKFLDRVVSLDWKKDYLIQSEYARHEQGEYLPDLKINTLMTKQKILDMIATAPRFSTGPNGVNRVMREVWKELYD